MNEKLTMTLKWLSYVALFFCAVWFVFLCYQSYHQVFDTTGSHILTLAVIGVCVAFFINLIKGIQHEELFPKKNIRLIFIAVLLIFLQTVASDNLDQAFISEGPAAIALTSNPFVQSLILLVFGILYKMGCQVAAEHDLTV